mmetsp:Transcript_23595/g.34964  ORF Transcript_23595/g.34964 Transcript_23595/m.34964 type:complete len:195 (-) Transcript_23595:1103-1687(-)
MKYISIIVLPALSASAFTVRPAANIRVSSALGSHSDISRRNALQSLIVPGILSLTAAFSEPAFADVTNKVASQSSLRYVKRSMKELEKLDFFAAQNDYSEIKQGIRGPGLAEIRKNALVLMRAAEDGPEAENLKNAYDAFIKDVEALDIAASLGVRGKKGVALYPVYQKSSKSLQEFAAVAARSVEIPLQASAE